MSAKSDRWRCRWAPFFGVGVSLPFCTPVVHATSALRVFVFAPRAAVCSGEGPRLLITSSRGRQGAGGWAPGNLPGEIKISLP